MLKTLALCLACIANAFPHGMSPFPDKDIWTHYPWYIGHEDAIKSIGNVALVVITGTTLLVSYL